MYKFIGKHKHFYVLDVKLNTNCPDSEKTGSGPGSCGGGKNKLQNNDISFDPIKFITPSEDLSNYSIGTDEYYNARNPGLKNFLYQAKDIKELNKLTQIAINLVTNDKRWTEGGIAHFKNLLKEEFRSKSYISNPTNNKNDRILNIRDSSGKAIRRKWQ